MGTTNLDRLVIDELVVAGSDITAAMAELATLDGLLSSVTELNYLDITSIGAVQASKACVVDANKDLGDFRNLDCVNLDAGSSGVAGTVDVFPTTALKGKAAYTCADQTGNTTVTYQTDAMGQATTVHTPDPGAAASYLAMSTAALALAEVDVLQGAGTTVVASKAVIADGDKDIVGLRQLWLGTNGVGGVAGVLNIQDGANPGATAAIAYADLFKIDGITDGTQAAGKCVVADTNVNTGISKVTELHIGATGAETQVTASAAELNYCDVTTLGTAQASKAVTTDANIDITALRNVTQTGAWQSSAGAATPAVAMRFGDTATEGLEIKVYEETIQLTNAVKTDTTLALPTPAIVLSAQANLQAVITGDGTGDNLLASVGLGVSGGDEDKYGNTTDLTQNQKIDTAPFATGAGETISIFALQADGNTACTEKFTGGAGQDVRVRIVYAAPNSLDNA